MIGQGKSIWNVGPLLSSGFAAPPGEEIISTQVTYGALGTCQNATLRTAKAVQVANRMALWTLRMAGYGNLFAGIVDQPTSNAGDLSQITLMAPHRQYLDALGVNIGYPYPLQSFGVPLGGGVQDWEKMSEVLAKVLDAYPTADYGVGPDLEGGIGLPEYGSPVTLDVSQALSVTQQGYSIPNYVTDAVFDPGDGWPKYTYKRDVLGYAPRVTGQATADPAIISQRKKLEWTRLKGPITITTNGIEFLHRDTIQADSSTVTYAEQDSTTTWVASDSGTFALSVPADTPAEHNVKLYIRCPFVMTKIEAWPPKPPPRVKPADGGYTMLYADNTTVQTSGSGVVVASTATNADLAAAINSLTSTVNNIASAVNQLGSSTTAVKAVDAANAAGDQLNKMQVTVNQTIDTLTQISSDTYTSRGTPKNGELKVMTSLFVGEDPVPFSTQSHVLKEAEIGLALAFEFEIDNLSKGAEIKVRYDLISQDTGKSITISFSPLEANLEYETPNLSAVKMPEGWEAPVSVGPVYEVKFRGWHIPPIRITGLPVGSQMAAGSTVTHNRQEATTTVTTMAWPYAGQRRT